MDRWLNNNTVVKVVSLLIAIMLWMVVNSDRMQTYFPGSADHSVTRITQMNLDARYNDRKYIVRVPTTVQVELKGSADQLALSAIMSGKTDVYVDLRNYSSGSYTVPVQWEGFPPGLEVRIQPSNVPVTIEAIQQVTRNVRVSVIGKAKDGYIAGQPVVSPQVATVTVPESQVDNVSMVQALVSIEDASGDIHTRVPLRVLDRNGQPIDAKVSPATADVQVPLTMEFKTVPVKIEPKGSLPNGYSVNSIVVNPPQVKIYGTADVLNAITSYPAGKIDVSQVTDAQTFEVTLPALKDVTKVDPPKVAVTVHVSLSSNSQPPAPGPTGLGGTGTQTTALKTIKKEVAINVKGSGNGMTSQVVDPPSGKLTAELEGNDSELTQLQNKDLQAVVDVSNLPPGEHTIKVKLNLPPDVKVLNETNMKTVVRIMDRSTGSSS
ncbi:CdaR family protein [Aneurinibacillus terranovensis]|uniref:CdaR family protein n=1 Tax=Aneurinibacillus terranovensis TaxID=278991 RepID=UPI00040B0FE5|nr:CdaR family protein [Aneurinibacillus terranovensis]